jgi:hypothetical protein
MASLRKLLKNKVKRKMIEQRSDALITTGNIKNSKIYYQN